MNGIEALAAVRAVHIASTVAVAGGFAFRLLVLPGPTQRPRVADAPADVVERRLLGWCGAALAIGAASWVAWLVITATSMSGLSVRQAVDLDVLGTVLGRTMFGRVWVLRLLCILALATCLAVLWRRGSPQAAAARASGVGLALVLLVTLVGTGHAVGGAPSDRVVHVGTDALHLLGAGAWLGALVPLLFVLTRAAVTGDRGWRALAAEVTRRFFALGVSSVLLLLGSGVLNAAWLVGSWTALGSTPYGRLVLAKVALFALVLAIAAVNRLVLTPRLGVPEAHHGAVRALQRNVIAELGIGAAITAIVGVLGVTPPAAHEQMGERHEMQGHEPADGRDHTLLESHSR